MTSQKQIEANQLNAKNSTGPKSEKGKQVSRMNAMKHGLTANKIVIFGESEKKFNDFRENLMEELDPETELEFQLADRACAQIWRLKRVPVFESLLIENHRLEIEYEIAENEIVSYTDYGARVTEKPRLRFEEAGCIPALERRESAEEGLQRPIASLGRALRRDLESLDTLGRLSRYEGSLIRGLNVTLAQLEKLQEKRHAISAEKSMLIEQKPNSVNE